ncbi:MAG: hypothetical protein ICV54_24035 [Nostoc sp. C3-bin3]|nr:hypothetical protein [Nostoc sp. C3-bin3]
MVNPEIVISIDLQFELDDSHFPSNFCDFAPDLLLTPYPITLIAHISKTFGNNREHRLLLDEGPSFVFRAMSTTGCAYATLTGMCLCLNLHQETSLNEITFDSIENKLFLLQNFFVDMYENNNKDTKFPHTKLRQLLKETGFISGAGDYGG